MEILVGGLIVIGLTFYTLLGGADFGAGVWEFNTVLRSSKKEKALIYSAIGPVWEANHVWLIFVIVTLANGFPIAFAGISRALWIPLVLALVGIFFRGVGFAFRSHAADKVKQQEIWGAVFALASTAAPFFLGACVGAIASGKLGVDEQGEFDGNYFGWITPLSIFCAFFGVGVCAYISSVFLTREANVLKDVELVKTWRRRSIATGIWMGILATAGIVIVATSDQELWEGFKVRSMPIVGASIVTGVFSLAALFRRWFNAAVIGAALTVTTVIWGGAIAQYPYLILPNVSFSSSKAPDSVLTAIVITVIIGAIVVIPAFVYLLYLFKGKHPEAGLNE